MQNWNKNREIASNLLLEAEDALKDGDEMTACIKQRKASKYGIDATTYLLKAMEQSESKEGLENIKVGLRKWKELGNSC